MRRCLNWPRPLPRTKVAHAGTAAAEPTIFEFSTHVDARRKQIVASLATKVGGATTY